MAKPKSNIKKFILLFSISNTILIILLVTACMFFLYQNKSLLKNIILKYSNYVALEKARLMRSLLTTRNIQKEQDLVRTVTEYSKKDKNIISVVIFSKTDDENFFRVRKTIRFISDFTFPFKRGQKVRENGYPNFLKNALLDNTIDPKLHTDTHHYWHSIYLPYAISATTLVIQYNVSATEAVTLFETYFKEENRNKLYMMICALLFIIISFALSSLLAYNVTKLIHNLTGFVKKVAKGDLNVSIKTEADADITELAHSFNSLVEELKDKEKKIDKLENQKNLTDIFKLGVVTLKNNNIDYAIAIFTTLSLLRPNKFGNFFNLGVAYAKNKNYEKSQQMFEKALHLDPNHEMTLNYLEKVKRLIRKYGKKEQ